MAPCYRLLLHVTHGRVPSVDYPFVAILDVFRRQANHSSALGDLRPIGETVPSLIFVFYPPYVLGSGSVI